MIWTNIVKIKIAFVSNISSILAWVQTQNVLSIYVWELKSNLLSLDEKNIFQFDGVNVVKRVVGKITYVMGL